jgi:hypothetical protein
MNSAGINDIMGDVKATRVRSWVDPDAGFRALSLAFGLFDVIQAILRGLARDRRDPHFIGD